MYTVKWSVLLLTIQFSMSKTKLNGFKYCYVSLTVQINISHLFTQLNDQTILFLMVHFSTGHLFALIKMWTCSIVPLIGFYQVLLFWAREYLGAISMKGYSTFLKDLSLLEPHHQIVWYNIQGNRRWASLTLLQRCTPYNLRQQPTGQKKIEMNTLIIDFKGMSNRVGLFYV